MIRPTNVVKQVPALQQALPANQGATMTFRPILLAVLFLSYLSYATASETKTEKHVKADPTALLLSGAASRPDDSLLSGVVSVKPEMPLGPADILKAYEIGMNMVVQQMSEDYRGILQAHNANQISSDEAEYLLQQRYQTAIMQLQTLGALHDVLKHDIDQAAAQAKQANQNIDPGADTVLTVPLPSSLSHRK